jgi:hypothetical protein
MIRKVSLIALGSVLLSGCFNVQTSQAPIATTYPLTTQQKMQAAHHWDVLAMHQAEQIMSNELLLARPLYISEDHATSQFTQAFGSLLTSHLVSRGASVKTTEANSLNVSFTVQAVKHKDRGYVRAPQGALTALTAGIAVATIPYNKLSEPALTLIPLAAAADLFSGNWTSKSDQEVIITTQVTDRDRILYSTSNIYYINGGDHDHYQSRRVTPTRTVNLTNTW